MDFNSIATLHKSNAAFLALRKEWLPLAVSFLHEAFKRRHEIQVPQDLLREQLDNYIEYVNARLPQDAQYKQDAGYYIDRWSREDDLIRIRHDNEQYVVQLSPHAERLLGWFEDMDSQGMIGTESRLRTIQLLLDEVVSRSTEDVEKRLQQLRGQRDQIDAEIARVEETQQVDGLSDVQIRERLEHISGLARELLRDFSYVEEKFREMARTIQQKQLDPELRRGDILNTVLNADEELDASDEGQSLRAFYELLTHPEQRSSFDTLINGVFETPRLRPFARDHVSLKRLTSHLLDAGERVNQSNQRLAEHLRRVVDTSNVVESRRVQTLAREIKQIISQLDESTLSSLRSRRTFYELEAEPRVQLPLERPLYEPAEKVESTERPRPASAVIDAETLTALYDTFHIDERELRDNIKRLLMSYSEITLSELAHSYPVRQGVAEVIAYMQIALCEPQHHIDHAVRDEIEISTRNGEEKTVIVPRVAFRRAGSYTEVPDA